jgi:hypothetical protein
VSPRIWTAEELARVWPLPEGWTWQWVYSYDGDVHCWAAVDGDAARVYIDSIGRLRCDDIDGEDFRVSLAVIGAHQGRDSVETIVAAIDGAAKSSHEDSLSDANEWHDAHSQGCSEAYEECAAILRRGKVAP